MAAPLGGSFASPTLLLPPVNTESWELDPFIASDESYLLFVSNREGGYGGPDLYVSFRLADGSWGEPVNLGEEVNSSADEVHPMVTLDGQYLFFTSNRTSHQRYSEVPLTYEEKLGILGSSGNRSEDIYWVDAEVLEGLRDLSRGGEGNG